LVVGLRTIQRLFDWLGMLRTEWARSPKRYVLLNPSVIAAKLTAPLQ
jgi:hypothetical protein